MVNGKYFTVDSHCHIFPDKIAQKAVNGTDTFYGTKSFGNGTVSDLLKAGTAAGVDKFVVQSVATTPKQVAGINRFIAEQVSEHGERFYGFGALHPESPDIKSDVKELISLGLHGVKLHPDIQGFKLNDPRCLAIYELCEENGLILLLHTGDYRYDNSNPNRLLPLLRKYTKLTVIGAHLGGWSLWETAYESLAGIPNLYVDCSSSLPYLTDEAARKAIYAYGANRVLFGTDYPMWDPEAEIKRLLSLGLDDNEYRMIFGDNAKKLFGI